MELKFEHVDNYSNLLIHMRTSHMSKHFQSFHHCGLKISNFITLPLSPLLKLTQLSLTDIHVHPITLKVEHQDHLRSLHYLVWPRQQVSCQNGYQMELSKRLCPAQSQQCLAQILLLHLLPGTGCSDRWLKRQVINARGL